MKRINKVYRAITAACLTLVLSANVNADWHLADGASVVHFISTKNQHNGEIHQFNELQGSLTEAGVLHLEISLASVETGIDSRNSRMREKLFLVDKFPKATLDAVLPEELMQLQTGHSVSMELPAKLTLMGIDKPLTIVAQISKTIDGQLIATSAKPVLLGAADFGLQPGVELLRQIAGLESIGLSVPVTFKLIFEPDV